MLANSRSVYRELTRFWNFRDTNLFFVGQTSNCRSAKMDNDTNMGEVPASRLLDPQIFEHLKNKIDEDQQVSCPAYTLLRVSDTVLCWQTCRRASRRRFKSLASLRRLPPSTRTTSKSRSVPTNLWMPQQHTDRIRYNQKWNRQVQNAIFTVLLCGWLGGLTSDGKPGPVARLLTLEEVGEIFKVPVNLKDRDAFHLTIEEYLLALTDVTQELSRLATNAVTLGDFALPVEISAFVKDLFAGFQLLNLKNDILRKRVDAVKYDVKRVEDVVYDLSLRSLIPKKEVTAGQEAAAAAETKN
ncbi:Translin-1 [Colletotrichum orbiculare MAFF 240422]|uniref:Translin-1 n=1 Tax=Colletotrichum orbiculare (strain 104-T / ATCC 96160 / CBS 514.97 / LARS 414 / MAFF 240422) TaxID=1213857 RepID=A0A484F7F4_COLOR|nr:Translin-1 [Colletotrichum orbiculare MAFF 240422]